MDYEILTAELIADPLGRGYAEMTDQEAADAMNAVDRTRNKTPHKAPLWQIKQLCLEQGVWFALKLAAATESPIQGAAATAVELIEDDRFENLDLDNAAAQQMLAALAAGGVVTQAQSDAIYALGTETLSRAAELGLPTVALQDIEIARGERPLIQRGE